MSKLIPNTTQFPNFLLEEVAPVISPASLRVLIAIVRRTYGFHKRSDRISFNHLQKLTGLSRVGVSEGLKGLAPLLKVQPGVKNSPTLEGITSYGINLDVPVDILVSKLYQYRNLTSKKRTLELVSKTYSSKEIIKESKSTPASSRKRKRPRDIPEQLQPIVLKVVGRINELAGTDYKPDSQIIADGLVAQLNSGRSESDCLAVVDNRWTEWGLDPKMQQHFNPETLFREKNFDKYLNAARMAQNSVAQVGGFVG